jgi:Flp pilus assembly protein TadD
MSTTGQLGNHMEKTGNVNQLDGMEPMQLMALGNQLMAQRRFDAAAATFQKLREVNPQDVNVLNSLGTALFMAGWQDMAMDCQHEAIRIKPDKAIFHVNLAKMLMVAQRWDQAASSMETALGHSGGTAKSEWHDLLNYCREMIDSSQAEPGIEIDIPVVTK